VSYRKLRGGAGLGFGENGLVWWVGGWDRSTIRLNGWEACSRQADEASLQAMHGLPPPDSPHDLLGLQLVGGADVLLVVVIWDACMHDGV
jgi:hypothetical protein